MASLENRGVPIKLQVRSLIAHSGDQFSTFRVQNV